MRYLRSNRMYCFSPPVMLATFCIEIGLAVYTLWRYKSSVVKKITLALLVCLALFQLAEYNVCEGAFGLSSIDWAKLGYVAITLLPPLGIHLIARLSRDTRRWLVCLGYGVSLVFVGIFLFVTHSIVASACLGNYVIFEQLPASSTWYGVYYYGFLIAALLYGLVRMRRATPQVSKAIARLIMGYLVFMIPTTIVNIVNPVTISGIPSIMCGFAVLLAFVLVFGVLPAYKKGVQ